MHDETHKKGMFFLQSPAEGLVVGGYEPPPHCLGTFVEFTSARSTPRTATTIQPWRMQKGS